MTIDTTTLLVVTGLVVAVAGVTFILSTALRRNERFGRIWSIAFVAGMLETISTVVWAVSPEGWWAGPVGNGTLVLAIGLMWAGCREYNRRTALTFVPVIAGAIVAAAGLVQGPDAGYWSAAVFSFAGIIVFAVLAAVETMRGALRHSIDARVLTVVFSVVAAYYFVRTVILVLAGESDPVFTAYFGTPTTTFVAIALVIVAAISMTALQPPDAPRFQDSAVGGRDREIPGVITAAQFSVQASDWLGRARRDKAPLVLLTLSVDGLAHINSAFGREFGDQAIYTVGRIACENAPSAALVAYGGGGRFTILASAPQYASAASVAERMQTALVETPLDTTRGIRAVAPCGITTTETTGYDLDKLVEAATAALAAAASSDRPGAIVVA